MGEALLALSCWMDAFGPPSGSVFRSFSLFYLHSCGLFFLFSAMVNGLILFVAGLSEPGFVISGSISQVRYSTFF